MVEADDLTAAVKRAEADLAGEQKKIDAEKKGMAAEAAELKGALEKLAAERADVTKALSPSVLSTFELISNRRNGIAIAEAREGVCVVCHVRLRPQVFNNILRNDQIIQCDSCNRIMYHVPKAAAAAAAPDAATQTAQ